MSFETERRLLETHFATEWAAGAYSTTPVNYENVQFVQPANTQAWVRFTILPGESFASSIGDQDTTCYRSAGLVVVQIYAPLDQGSQLSRQLSDEVGRIFRGETINDSGQVIRIRAPSVSGGLASDGWYQTTVTVGFIRDVRF